MVRHAPFISPLLPVSPTYAQEMCNASLAGKHADNVQQK
jgi:hypothetical protein